MGLLRLEKRGMLVNNLSSFFPGYGIDGFSVMSMPRATKRKLVSLEGVDPLKLVLRKLSEDRKFLMLGMDRRN